VLPAAAPPRSAGTATFSAEVAHGAGPAACGGEVEAAAVAGGDVLTAGVLFGVTVPLDGVLVVLSGVLLAVVLHAATKAVAQAAPAAALSILARLVAGFICVSSFSAPPVCPRRPRPL
jgi:hypothetical protein